MEAEGGEWRLRDLDMLCGVWGEVAAEREQIELNRVEAVDRRRDTHGQGALPVKLPARCQMGVSSLCLGVGEAWGS